MNNDIANMLGEDEDFQPVIRENKRTDPLSKEVSVWCCGFLRGVSLRPTQWKGADEQLHKFLSPILMSSLVIERQHHQFAEAMQKIESKDAFPNIRNNMFSNYISESVRGIHAIWRKEDMQDGMPGIPPTRPKHKSLTKVGRNQPCPCGSGKKYKKCCLS